MATILVVDDDKVFRGLLKTVFDMSGYRTVVTPHLDEVIPTMRQEEPALVLMDLNIAGGDTLDLLRRIKGNDTLKGTPVIMTSGMSRSAECLDAGADTFLLKPFRPSEVLESIRQLIESE